MMVPKLRAPIVLVHGLMGFDRLRVGPMVVAEYFRGVPQLYQEAGNKVLLASLSPTRGVAARARELKALLDRQFPGEGVHLIAHSMGGLDSRFLISQLGMGHRVVSLTTLGTPHRGTPLADWGLFRFARIVRPGLHFLGVPYQAFYDLSTGACSRFNQQNPDDLRVRYFSVAGRMAPDQLVTLLAWPRWMIEQVEGPNDGLVSLTSAQYGESCEEWEGHHLDLVNWHTPWASAERRRDRLPDYVRLIGRLADEGF
jgi:triacylglycerol lipase